MNTWRLSMAAERLRKEINGIWPNRDKKSDGALGDRAHSARQSDHNPDENGWVRAIDVDEDLNGKDGSDPVLANRLAGALVEIAKRDKRIKYIIFEGQIWSPKSRWSPRKYDGVNAHLHHIHVSFTPSGDTDGCSFGLKEYFQ